ncbi:MAG: FHA domain-containing protein [Myxococcota bacterium]
MASRTPPKPVPASRPLKPAALPEGPARLEGFLARARAVLASENPQYTEAQRQAERRAVGVRLEEELRQTASRVGAGLALHLEPVRVCCQLLESAGELARAARLLMDAGRPAEAADLAGRAGELELMQRALAAAGEPQDRSGEASVAFAAYEAAMGRGHLTDALLAVERALRARPDNPAYPDLRDKLLARRPAPPRLLLEGDGGLLVALGLAPAWVGRGEDAVLRVQAPGVSRQHARVEVRDGSAVLSAGGAVLWSSQLTDDVMGPPATVMAGALLLGVRTAGWAVEVWPAANPQTRALVLVGNGTGQMELGEGNLARVTLKWPVGGWPRLGVVDGALHVDDDVALPGGYDVSVGSRVRVGSREWVCRG